LTTTQANRADVDDGGPVGLLRRPIGNDNSAMSGHFQPSKRTVVYASLWLCSGVMAGWFGISARVLPPAIEILGYVIAFNCFWAAVDCLRGQRFARIALSRLIIVALMMLGYWVLVNVKPLEGPARE
jgi:hypothetical protein